MSCPERVEVRLLQLLACWSQGGGGGGGVQLKVGQHEEEQQRSYEEQSVLALEDRKSAVVRAMNSPHTGESHDL